MSTAGSVGTGRDLANELPLRLERADGSVGIVYLSLPGTADGALVELTDRLAGLPLGDEQYHLGDGEVVVVGDGDAERRVLGVVAPVAGVGLLCGAASFPEDGHDPAALIDRAAAGATTVAYAASPRWALRLAPVAAAIVAVLVALLAAGLPGPGGGGESPPEAEIAVEFDSGRGDGATDDRAGSTTVTSADAGTTSTEVTAEGTTRATGSTFAGAAASADGAEESSTVVSAPPPAATATTAAPAEEDEGDDWDWRDRWWDGDDDGHDESTTTTAAPEPEEEPDEEPEETTTTAPEETTSTTDTTAPEDTTTTTEDECRKHCDGDDDDDD
jgi:hypothetical protein